MKVIDSFSGIYNFLSNFYPSRLQFGGMSFFSVENAFQSAKTIDPDLKVQFMGCSPSIAKRLGRRVKLRDDWEEVKNEVMLILVRKKFSDPVLAKLLIDTGDAVLIEGNTWGDTYWGCCDGVGQNHLGKILMQVRQELLSDI